MYADMYIFIEILNIIIYNVPIWYFVLRSIKVKISNFQTVPEGMFETEGK
jgi:hypothetical protein